MDEKTSYGRPALTSQGATLPASVSPFASRPALRSVTPAHRVSNLSASRTSTFWTLPLKKKPVPKGLGVDDAGPSDAEMEALFACPTRPRVTNENLPQVILYGNRMSMEDPSFGFYRPQWDAGASSKNLTNQAFGQPLATQGAPSAPHPISH